MDLASWCLARLFIKDPEDLPAVSNGLHSKPLQHFAVIYDWYSVKSQLDRNCGYYLSEPEFFPPGHYAYHVTTEGNSVIGHSSTQQIACARHLRDFYSQGHIFWKLLHSTVLNCLKKKREVWPCLWGSLFLFKKSWCWKIFLRISSWWFCGLAESL